MTSPLRRALRRLARRRSPDATVRLDDVRRRLEILVAALYGRAIPLVTAPAPGARRGDVQWMRGLSRWLATGLGRRAPDPGDGGERIRLPAALDARPDAAAALRRYQLLAVRQAELLARGSAAWTPGDDAPLERDLFVILESAAVDERIARTLPGLAATLEAERAAALGERPRPESLRPAEREVEALLRDLLEHAPAGATMPNGATSPDPAASLARAREIAAGLAGGARRYRGVPPVRAWDSLALLAADDGAAASAQEAAAPSPEDGDAEVEVPEAGPAEKQRRRRSHRLPRPMGLNMGGLHRSTADSPWGEGTPELAEDGRHRSPMLVSGAEEPGADPADGDEPRDRAREGSGEEAPPDVEAGDVAYAEWDWRAERYHPAGAVVRLFPSELGDAGWARAALRRDAALVRRVRERFEPLRPRRVRLTRQRDGDDLDLDACVRTLVDLRTGHTVDGRLYLDVRPARREMAIALLVDISGSTSLPAGEGAARIIDVEKAALLLTSAAFDALGDRYAILTFSGEGAANVRVRSIKDFAEPNGATVHARIAALRPEGYTRLGAAVRHATALLTEQGTAHRLLLILSDGRPNDVGVYAGRYGVEDSRQAVAEARTAGVYPFCLTIDRRGSDYLARIFGTAGHRVLRRPEQLPQALVAVVGQLLRGG